MKQLVGFSEHVQYFQIVGGPNWMDSEKYDITAKAEDAVDTPRIEAMVQTLLASRFKVTLHRETKEMQGYALVTAKSASRPPVTKCVDGRTADDRICGTFAININRAPGDPTGGGRIEGNDVSMSMFARALEYVLAHSVVDMTDLDGNFDIKLAWGPDDAGPADPRLPFFTALQEQLGLKLQSQKGPVEIVVVDHAERPAEN